MEFITPTFKRKENPSGVYKITFDDLYFYIGGSTKLKSRVGHWKHRLKLGTPKNKNIKRLLPSCKLAKMEIIKLVHRDLVKTEEDAAIKVHFNSPYCLNRCPSAFDNTGLKFSPGEIIQYPRCSIKRKLYTDEDRKRSREMSIERGVGQPVAKFDLKNNYIETFACVSMAAESVGVPSRDIGKMFNGKRKSIKGFVFKKVDDSGNIIENKKIPRKKWPKRGPMSVNEKMRMKEIATKLYKENPELFMRGEPPKKIDVFNIKGEYVISFPSVNQASKALNILSGNICKVLKNKRPHTNGYIFKYAG